MDAGIAETGAAIEEDDASIAGDDATAAADSPAIVPAAGIDLLVSSMPGAAGPSTAPPGVSDPVGMAGTATA